MPANAPPKPVTLSTLRRRVKAGTPFPVLTAYDATTAKWLVRGGVDVMLVGDTAGQMILGEPGTIQAPLPFMLTLTAAVKRGADAASPAGAYVIGDMPFGSYQESEAQAVRNAIKFLTNGYADAVKLETDAAHPPLVRKLADEGVPVIAHMGFRPQRTAMTGVPTVAGKTAADQTRMIDLAQRFVDAGAVMLLLEATTAETAGAILDACGNLDEGGVPIIGCGAGPDCHAHVVVLHDLLGLTDRQPAFAPPLADGGTQLAKVAGRWKDLVEQRRYLADGGPYHMK